MKGFNWVVVLVLVIIGGIIGLIIPGIPAWFISYLFFATSITHNQWLNDRRLKTGGVG